jgi:hypothetical protein
VAVPSIVVAQADTRATEGDVATAAPLGGPTVFDASAPAHAAGTTSATTAMAAPRFPHMAVRPGEHVAAPFLDHEGGPRDAGIIVLSSEMTAVALETPRSPFQLREEVYIKLPKGATGDLGQRFLTYRLGPDYERYGQVVIPTGVVEVVHPAGPREATTVRISQMFGNMEVGQGVIPMDNPEFPAANAMVASVEGGPRSFVLWIDDEVVMTSLEYYLVLPIKESDGYRIGDQITLVRPPDKDYDTGLVLPEVRIGIAQVVRVTPRSATAIVIHQDQPAISPGVVTRVSAKMP